MSEMSAHRENTSPPVWLRSVRRELGGATLSAPRRARLRQCGDTAHFPGSLSLPYPSELRGGQSLLFVGDCIFAVCGEVSGVGLPGGLDRLRPTTHHPRPSEWIAAGREVPTALGLSAHWFAQPQGHTAWPRIAVSGVWSACVVQRLN